MIQQDTSRLRLEPESPGAAAGSDATARRPSAWRRASERMRTLLWRLNGLDAVAPAMYAEDMELTFRAGES